VRSTGVETAAAERDPDRIYSLRDPDFDRLHDSPRFIALKVRLKPDATY